MQDITFDSLMAITNSYNELAKLYGPEKAKDLLENLLETVTP